VLKTIPAGRVATYADIAAAIGNPRAARAVGNVLNRNPNAPQVPCHRVVRGDGSIGGYAFGPNKKIALLQKEGVIHKPATQRVEKYLPLMDIYVLSSLTETTSLSTLEAMSCGLPCITTKVGYIRDYITEGKNGLFFPKKNSYILSKKIIYLANNKTERKRLGKEARKTIIEKFNWDNTAEEIESFFKTIIEEE
jgi:O-6-methylguanine DNA methyltransferase